MFSDRNDSFKNPVVTFGTAAGTNVQVLIFPPNKKDDPLAGAPENRPCLLCLESRSRRLDILVNF